MQFVIIAIVAIVVALAFIMLRQRESAGSSADHSTALRILEEKLALLEQCGIKLKPEFTQDDLLTAMDHANYENPGWDTLLISLGSEEEQGYLSNNVWYFDTECIEDHGDYKRIVVRMAELAGGSLPLQEIKDYVEVEDGQAWVSFKLDGKDIKIDCKVDDDWVDTDVLTKIADLLQQCDSSKAFTYYNLGGQDCLIGCVTKAQLKQLRSHGISFEALR